MMTAEWWLFLYSIHHCCIAHAPFLSHSFPFPFALSLSFAISSFLSSSITSRLSSSLLGLAAIPSFFPPAALTTRESLKSPSASHIFLTVSANFPSSMSLSRFPSSSSTIRSPYINRKWMLFLGTTSTLIIQLFGRYLIPFRFSHRVSTPAIFVGALGCCTFDCFFLLFRSKQYFFISTSTSNCIPEYYL